MLTVPQRLGFNTETPFRWLNRENDPFDPDWVFPFRRNVFTQSTLPLSMPNISHELHIDLLLIESVAFTDPVRSNPFRSDPFEFRISVLSCRYVPVIDTVGAFHPETG